MNIKKIINNYNLFSKNKLLLFLRNNPESLSLKILSEIAEMANSNRLKTAAYYTDEATTKYLSNLLPDIDSETIRILEPSVGIGNFLPILFEKYSNKNKVILDLIDIDLNSLLILKELNRYRNVPDNFVIRYHNVDFFDFEQNFQYDLIIGNPPFLLKGKVENWHKISKDLNDNISTNLSSLFLQKSLLHSKNVLLIMPKYFLSSNNFALCRERVKQYEINSIVDLGEHGFKGVLIETIAISINTVNSPSTTNVYSVNKGIKNQIKQAELTDDNLPNWILYRNDFFDSIYEKMITNVFEVTRDRAIHNKDLNYDRKGVRVLKSRNISRTTNEIIDIPGYDAYIATEVLNSKNIKKYRYETNVYLTPNMTYYPRVVKKPSDCVVNGSVAILKNTSNYEIKKKHIDFWNSKVFEEFYAIAMNYSTRSLNIDSRSIKYFGLYEGD